MFVGAILLAIAAFAAMAGVGYQLNNIDFAQDTILCHVATQSSPGMGCENQARKGKKAAHGAFLFLIVAGACTLLSILCFNAA